MDFMKRLSPLQWIPVLAALALLVSGAPLSSERVGQVAESNQGFTVERGTNISHWLSQSSRRGDARRAYFTRDDVELLAELGFDHLRIPVDEEQLWGQDGSPNAEAFDLLNSALDWSAEFGLKAIIDLHILRSHHFNSRERPLWTETGAQERFLQCWRDLSARLGHRPNRLVAYELMNEPVAPDPEDWNGLAARTVRLIRDREPQRTIVIGSNRWQSAETFDRLKVPSGDPNLLLSFHFYLPFPFTHYRASWTKVGEYEGPVRYPGEVVTDEDLKGLPEDLIGAIGRQRHFDRDILEQFLAKPLALAQETGLPLYCGEWGALPTVPRSDRLRWYSDVRSIFEEHGIGWATWDYKGSFGLVGRDGTIDRELVEVLGLNVPR